MYSRRNTLKKNPIFLKTTITTVLAFTLGLSACGAPDANSGKNTTSSTGPIKIWLSNNEQELKWGKAVVSSWNEKHPNEKVKAQEIPASSSSEEAITAAITAGTSPCLIYNISSSAVPGWVRQGGLVNLSKIADGNSYIEGRSGKSAEHYKTNGDYYQLPWKQNPIMLIYNKDIFQKAGIDPENPKMDTYASFLEGARKIVNSGASQSAIWPAPTNEFYQPWNDFYPLYLAATDGVPLIKDKKATFDDENGRDVTEFFRTLYAENLAPKEKPTDDAMSQGTTAMQLAGPWAVAAYKGKVNTGVMPIPTKDGKKDVTTFADSKNISMFTSCKAQGTAWKFLKYSTGKDQDKRFIEATGQIPIRSDSGSIYQSFVAKNPAYKPYVDQALRTGDVPSLMNSVEVWQTFRKLWSNDVIFGKTSSQEFVDSAAKSINELARKG